MHLIFPLAISLSLTLILELAFSLCWGIRKKLDLIVVTLANMLTNPIVVLLYYTFPELRSLVLLLELGAVIAEALCFCFCSPSIQRPFLFALCANLFSYSMGCIANYLL